MRTVALAATFLIALAGFLAARAPLSAALGAAGLTARGVSYEAAEGTIWRGRVRGARVRGQTIGDISVNLSPMALLRGGVAAEARVAGLVDGRGRLTGGLGGGAWTITDATALVRARDFRALHPELANRSGEVFARLDRLVVSPQMACLEAEGRVQTDILQEPGGGRNVWRGPLLEGPVTCEDGAIAIGLSGEDDTAVVEMTARVDLRTGSVFEAVVRTEDDQARFALGLLGFVEDGDGFAYRVEQRFR